MQQAYRAAIVLLFAMMALAAMSYLSGRFAQGDVEKAVAAVQAHLYGEGGEAALREWLGQGYGLTHPELRWGGRVTSDFYGVVQVTLVARETGRAVEFVWEMGLISGELVPKNEAAAALLRLAAPVSSAG